MLNKVLSSREVGNDENEARSPNKDPGKLLDKSMEVPPRYLMYVCRCFAAGRGCGVQCWLVQWFATGDGATCGFREGEARHTVAFFN